MPETRKSELRAVAARDRRFADAVNIRLVLTYITQIYNEAGIRLTLVLACLASPRNFATKPKRAGTFVVRAKKYLMRHRDNVC